MALCGLAPTTGLWCCLLIPRAVKGVTKEAVCWLEKRGWMLLLPPLGVTDVGLRPPPSIIVEYDC